MLHNLAKALLIHGKIRTTEIKAKELRRVVEPLITLAKRNDLHARRQAYRVLNDHAFLKMAMPRKGDNAPMAIIELSRSSETAAAEAPKAAKAAPVKEAKPAAEEAPAKPKRTRKPKADEADAEAAKEEN